MKSKCCQTLVKVVGDTTKHYQCTKCGEPCDLYTEPKTLDEKFDDKFDVMPHLKKVLYKSMKGIVVYDFINKWLPKRDEEIKQFYNKEIKVMLDEIVGEDDVTKWGVHSDGQVKGYYKKRQEIISIIKKHGFLKKIK